MSHNSDDQPSLLKFEASDVALAHETDGQRSLQFRLNGSQAKTAFALRRNAETLINGSGLGHFEADPDGKPFWKVAKPEFIHSTGFLTLTVGDYFCTFHGKQIPAPDDHCHCPVCKARMHFVKIQDSGEANRRINNLNRKLLPQLFSRAIVVTERHHDGGVHYHLLGRLASGANIRSGISWTALAKRDYRSAPLPLREVWAVLRDRLPLYGFGRHELLPIRKTSEAVASYISKYIEKNICNRLKADKRKKLVRYIGWSKQQLKSNEFSWCTTRSIAWRGKARDLGSTLGMLKPEDCAEALGPRWAMKLTEIWQGRAKDDCAPFLNVDLLVKRLMTSDLANAVKKVSPDWLQNQERRKIYRALEQPQMELLPQTRYARAESPEEAKEALADCNSPYVWTAQEADEFADGWAKYVEFENAREAAGRAAYEAEFGEKTMCQAELN